MGNWEGPELEDSWLCVGWLADVLELSLCSSFFTFVCVCVCVCARAGVCVCVLGIV